MAVRNADAAFQESVDAIFQVSISANKESYARLIKEDPDMCEAMRDLMKEDFARVEAIGEARGISIGEARGISIGEIRGAIKTYYDCIDKRVEPLRSLKLYEII